MLRPPFEVPLTLADTDEDGDPALDLFRKERAEAGNLDFESARPFAVSLGPSRWLVWALLGAPAMLFLVAWVVVASGSSRRGGIEGAQRLPAAMDRPFGSGPERVPAAQLPAAAEDRAPAAPAEAAGTATDTRQSTAQPAEQPEAGFAEPASRTARSAAATMSATSKSRPTLPAARDALAGTLNVESRPIGASVYIDEQLVGTTPMTLLQISPGAHALRLHLDAHRDWTSTVQIDPDARNRVTAGLEEDENVPGP